MRYRLIIGLILLLTAFWLIDYFTPYDDTDNMAEGERSGISLYTDNLTGCQYLRFGIFGGVLPRVKDGVHIGRKQHVLQR